MFRKWTSLFVSLLGNQKENMTITEKIVDWAEDKNLTSFSTITKQLEKLDEEVHELNFAVHNLVKYPKEMDWDIDDFDDAVLELGDCLVVLTILAEQLGVTPAHCRERAWEKIKNRTGKTVDGKFVKD